MNDQRPLTDQLITLVQVANREGLYDAADWLNEVMRKHQYPMVPNDEGMRELAARLRERQAPCNDGRGISCVRTICQHLMLGSWDNASHVFRIDSDKLRAHPEILGYLTGWFGCPVHLKMNCECQRAPV